jgi:SpoVK/Ycf46/Vps4 family AAA+-type ATPase
VLRTQVDLPDCAARESILRVKLRSAAVAPGVDVPALAARLEGCSGADLENIVREAALAALREAIDAPRIVSAAPRGVRWRVVLTRQRAQELKHFDAAVVMVRPSVAAQAPFELAEPAALE